MQESCARYEFLKFRFLTILIICMFCTGIATANYSHVKYFPSRQLYDDFYSVLLRVVKIGVESFAPVVQQKLVDKLFHVDPSGKSGAWYRDFWTGARGRYCACHAGYCGSNNNMGVEVDWRDVKKICPSRANLGTFIGALVHFIKQLGEEHKEFLLSQGTPQRFPTIPQFDKEIWTRMQEVHPKTLSCCYIVSGRGGGKLPMEFAVVAQNILDTGDMDTPLHLKIRAWHCDRGDEPLPIKLSDIKVVLMPRQHLLKRFDPDGERSVEEVCDMLRDARSDYFHYVVEAEVPPADMDVELLLDCYETHHMLTRATNWGPPVEMSCTCLKGYTDCACSHSALLASIFDASIRVPDEYIASQPSARKKAKLIKGTAGPRRARLLKEIEAERGKTESKIKYMDMAKTFVEEDDDVTVHPRPKAGGRKSSDKRSTGGSRVMIYFAPFLFSPLTFAVLVRVPCTRRRRRRRRPRHIPCPRPRNRKASLVGSRGRLKRYPRRRLRYLKWRNIEVS